MKKRQSKVKKKYIDGRPYKVQVILDDNKKFDTVFLDFAMVIKLRDHFLQYGEHYQAKAANALFGKIKKEFEKENPNTLLILNHPISFNRGSGIASDFLVELCLYTKIESWSKSILDHYFQVMIPYVEIIKEKINRALQ